MRLFKKKSIGIDIADLSIEVAEIERGVNGIKILNLSRTILKPGIVEHGRIKNETKLAKAIKKTLLNASSHPIIGKKIIFGLPESQVYTHVFNLSPHNKKERDALILKEACKNIPLKKENLLFDYKIIKRNKDSLEILLIAVNQEVVLEWQEFFEKIGLEVILFDFETLAIFRGIFAKPPQFPVCIVDIGAFTTNISIFDKQRLYYSHSIDLAGNIFTQEIAKSLKIELEEAEKMKIEIGLKDESHKIFSILTKHLEVINKEIKILIDYFQKKTNQKIEDIIFVGGSSRLIKIVNYFDANLGLKTRIGQSFLIIKERVPLEYIQAIGIALRGIDKKWSKTDPVLKPLEQSSINISQKTSRETIQDIKAPSSLNIKFRPERKKNSKKKLLISILIIGVILIGIAYWYKNSKKIDGEEKAKAQLEELDKKIKKNEEEIAKDEVKDIVEKKELVLIKENELGWLNVREGAGINYPILTKIYPGESYPLLEKLERWYKIELDNNQEGWIFSEYARIYTN